MLLLKNLETPQHNKNIPALQLECACSLLTRIPINHKKQDSWWFQGCCCLTDCAEDVMNCNLECIGVIQTYVGFFSLDYDCSTAVSITCWSWYGRWKKGKRKGKKWILELMTSDWKPGNATVGCSRLAWLPWGLCLPREGCGADSKAGRSRAGGNGAQTQSCKLPNNFAGSSDLQLLWLKFTLSRTAVAAVGTCTESLTCPSSQECCRSNFLEVCVLLPIGLSPLMLMKCSELSCKKG